MASEIFALLRCVRTADRHTDGALIGFTEENEAREELCHPWVKTEKVSSCCSVVDNDILCIIGTLPRRLLLPY